MNYSNKLPSFSDALHSKVATATLRILIEKDMSLPISRIDSNYVTVKKHTLRKQTL